MTAAADRRGLHTPLCSNKPYRCKTTLGPLQSSHLQSVIKDVIVKLLFNPLKSTLGHGPGYIYGPWWRSAPTDSCSDSWFASSWVSLDVLCVFLQLSLLLNISWVNIEFA